MYCWERGLPVTTGAGSPVFWADVRALEILVYADFPAAGIVTYHICVIHSVSHRSMNYGVPAIRKVLHILAWYNKEQNKVWKSPVHRLRLVHRNVLFGLDGAFLKNWINYQYLKMGIFPIKICIPASVEKTEAPSPHLGPSSCRIR